MTTLYLIRHAEAEGNLCRRIHGWYNGAITPNGYVQIAALEERFREIPIDAVYSSDLSRTMTTARAIYKSHGLPLHTRADLREINLGTWEDRTWGDVARNDSTTMGYFTTLSPHFHPEGSETFLEAAHRVLGGLKEIASAHPDQTVAVFCHGNVIRCVQAVLEGMHPFDATHLSHCDNTGVTLFHVEDGAFEKVYASDSTHLSDEISTFARQHWWRKDSGTVRDSNLWFRPLDVLEGEKHIYLEARKEAWENIRGQVKGFDGDGMLSVAQASAKIDPNYVMCGMLGDDFAGIIQLDPTYKAELGVGYIPFVYMAPHARKKGLGIQLLGHAISQYRALGRTTLQLRCDPNNQVAQRFYARYGFEKVGTEQSGSLYLEILEKQLG